MRRNMFVLLRVAAVIGAALLLQGVALGQTGDGYDLSWNKISAGGGATRGDSYSLVATIGQVEASSMASGNYSLTGGFHVVLSTLRGDINTDGYVNVGDLQRLVAAWGTSRNETTFQEWCDVNDDGYVNVGDLQILVANWGRGN